MMKDTVAIPVALTRSRESLQARKAAAEAIVAELGDNKLNAAQKLLYDGAAKQIEAADEEIAAVEAELDGYGDRPFTPEEITQRREDEKNYWAEREAYEREQRYSDERKAELAVLDGEGLDALRKELAALRAGEPETEDYAEYRQKVEVVKQKYPKPTKGKDDV